MQKIVYFVSIFFNLIILKQQVVNCINSYIYLTDKVIQEELPIGTVIIELNDELNKYYYSHAAQFQSPSTSFADQQYTFLDEIQTRFASSTYFLLDSFTGRVTTKRYIDRESMCLNRHCMEICVENNIQSSLSNSHNNNGSLPTNQCKLNLKILLQPSSNIVSINIIVDDINDNKPQFRKDFFNQTVPENVPVGYRIPVELAFDPDVGRNSIQYYELVQHNANFNTVFDTFELKQNLNEMQLAIIVKKKLDREIQSMYSFSIVAHDGGIPSYSGRLDCLIQIMDINDNNPMFDQDVYKFKLNEDTKVGTQVGYLHAFDLDEGPNARIKYSLVGSVINGINGVANPILVMHNYASYFEIDLYSGLLTLRKQLDYEDEPVFSLTVEARDCGVGSLPAYTTIEITLIDCNDNPPEISVSFLNSLKRKITGLELGFNSYTHPLVIYVNENTEVNKFISHVSITDKDSFENGRISWIVELNNERLAVNDTRNYLKITLLNSNSFTINTGKKFIDREEIQYLNISILAWDHGFPVANNASYKFQIEIIDENDNKPKFDASVYNLTMYENNKISDSIIKFNATDADTGENARITYKLKDSLNRLDEKLFTIDPATGVLRTRKVFDRELRSIYRFYVTAIDNGLKQQLSTSVLVNLKILDVNDNVPKIYFYKNQTKYYDSFNDMNQTLILTVNENILFNTQIIQFHANDSDINENAIVRFYVNETNYFRINEITGQLFLVKKLDREHINLHSFKVNCENVVGSFLNNSTKLSSFIHLVIKVADINDNCPYGINLTEKRFINSSKSNSGSNLNLFSLKYADSDEGINSRLAFTLLKYTQFFELNAKYDVNSETYDIQINMKPDLSESKLKLGKYVIKLKISDYGDPKCEIVNHFQLFIGNQIFNTYGLLTEALKVAKDKSSEEKEDFQYDQLNYDYDYNMRMKDFFNTDTEYEFDINSTLNSINPSTTDIISDERFENANKIKKFNLLNFIDFDHVLVFIMLLIVILIGILISLLGIVYFYKKYSQARIKTILKNGNNSTATSDTATNNSIDDFEKLKFEQQQYFYLKQQQKQRMQSYSITNNSSNLSPEGLYSSNSFSLHSANDDSMASSAVTKETKLNNLSVNDHQHQTIKQFILASSSSSTSSTDGIRSTQLPFSTLRSVSGYSQPISSNRSIISTNNSSSKRDEILLTDKQMRGPVKQVPLPISTIYANSIYQPNFILAKAGQRENQVNLMHSKSFINSEDILVNDDEEEEEYNEKFSFLNEYKMNNKQNHYKNSDL